MSFNFYLFKGLRLLLFPFSLLAALYIRIRNWAYDKGWLQTVSFNLPVICIGNLSVGGTGKSPMTEYLTAILKSSHNVALLSRGYKRKTRGYVLAGETTTAIDIGDEPMQFYLKFPDVAVAVGEERVEAIPQLLQDRPDTHVIILDDAFQHRRIRAGLNIVLTDCGNPYWNDWFLPTGELRDERKSARRADIIVVTKCPPDLPEDKRQRAIRRISPLPHQQVFFATIEYGLPYHILTRQPLVLSQEQEVLLICGIANPLPLKKYLEEKTGMYIERSYSDHYIFTIDDWEDMLADFNRLQPDRRLMLTTEKDAVRLLKFGDKLRDVPLYVLPVRHRILFGEAEKFENRIREFVDTFQRIPQS